MEKKSSNTGAWLESHDPGERQFIKIGFLLLENGETLPDVTIAYQTWGQLNAAKDNAILVNHAMTGWSDVPGWWPCLLYTSPSPRDGLLSRMPSSA